MFNTNRVANNATDYIIIVIWCGVISCTCSVISSVILHFENEEKPFVLSISTIVLLLSGIIALIFDIYVLLDLLPYSAIKYGRGLPNKFMYHIGICVALFIVCSVCGSVVYHIIIYRNYSYFIHYVVYTTAAYISSFIAIGAMLYGRHTTMTMFYEELAKDAK